MNGASAPFRFFEGEYFKLCYGSVEFCFSMFDGALPTKN